MKDQINRLAGDSVKKAPKFFNIVEKIENFRNERMVEDSGVKEFFEFFSKPENLISVPKDFKFNREELYKDI